MNWFFSHKLRHILFWTIYFVFWPGFSIYNYKAHLLTTLLITTKWMAGQSEICYLSAYLLIPSFYNRKRYVLFILCKLSGLLASAAFIAICMNYLLVRTSTAYILPLISLYFFALMANFYTVFPFPAIKTTRDRIKNERRNRGWKR
ncbi:MAG TPA: hypothetical protein VNE41_05000 [Chitinophagaceae bacterium]|nr:hypothetical protein [Chitinophagaceae bacterium]